MTDCGRDLPPKPQALCACIVKHWPDAPEDQIERWAISLVRDYPAISNPARVIEEASRHDAMAPVQNRKGPYQIGQYLNSWFSNYREKAPAKPQVTYKVEPVSPDGPPSSLSDEAAELALRAVKGYPVPGPWFMRVWNSVVKNGQQVPSWCVVEGYTDKLVKAGIVGMERGQVVRVWDGDPTLEQLTAEPDPDIVARVEKIMSKGASVDAVVASTVTAMEGW
tara:strand:+ start:982 stop:1647 length:666 start_codon:yes stop_codon:yes gene_type:complete